MENKNIDKSLLKRPSFEEWLYFKDYPYWDIQILSFSHKPCENCLRYCDYNMDGTNYN